MEAGRAESFDSNFIAAFPTRVGAVGATARRIAVIVARDILTKDVPRQGLSRTGDLDQIEKLPKRAQRKVRPMESLLPLLDPQ